MRRSEKRYEGSIEISLKWLLRLAGAALLCVASAMVTGPFVGIGSIVYVRWVALLAGFAVACLIAADFVEG